VVIVPGVALSPGWSASPGRPVVLIVDGQPLFMSAISHLLGGSELGAQTVTAQGSDIALEVLRTQPVDLVLCDVRIRPTPFRDFMMQVALLPDPPPIILLGDSQDEELLVTAIDSEAAGLFTKDADPNQFLQGVQAVLAGHRALDQNLMRLVAARLAGKSTSRTPAGLSELSPTELDILAMVGTAASIQDIAASRGISPKTVRNHMASIYRKLKLGSRTQAMLCAARMGLTPS
jgi:two-component system, NarL family, response regulator LiaR